MGNLLNVDEIDVHGVVALEPPDDPPIGRNGDRPEADATAIELVQAISRQVHLFGRIRRIDLGQDVLDTVEQVGSDLSFLTTLKEPPSAAVAGADDHVSC